MATIVNNNNGTLTVTLTPIEAQTVGSLRDDSLEQYMTLWLEERAKKLFNDLFNNLTPEEKNSVLALFAGKG